MAMHDDPCAIRAPRALERLKEQAPERVRPDSREHPNLERAGAQPHPAMARRPEPHDRPAAPR